MTSPPKLNELSQPRWQDACHRSGQYRSINKPDGRRQTAQSDFVCHAQAKETAAKKASEKSLNTKDKNKN